MKRTSGTGPFYTSTCICDFIFVCFLSFIRSLCPAQTWNSQFCSRHSFQENPEFISRPKAKPKRSQKRSLISKKRPFTRPGPTLNEAAARDMQNNPHGPKWHIQIPDLPRTRPDAHVVQMHNAQINVSYCWQSILNKYTTHGIEILDVSLWKEVHSWFDKSAFGISVNVLISYGDCTTMVDKIIKSFAKRSRNTKSEASNDSPLSGLFILPIPHLQERIFLEKVRRNAELSLEALPGSQILALAHALPYFEVLQSITLEHFECSQEEAEAFAKVGFWYCFTLYGFQLASINRSNLCWHVAMYNSSVCTSCASQSKRL